MLKSIKILEIFVPERLREVEEDHALAIQASIVEHGLLNPITVRSTPNQGKGKQPYSLVAGAHRLRAIELLDDLEIEAMIVEADALEAQLIEIEENVFRNDLSAMDRAIFIQSYRDVWEEKHGKIRRGNPNQGNCANLAQLIEEEAEKGFATNVAERLGFSKRSIFRANQIAQNLPVALRKKIRGTSLADNQSALLKIASLPPEKRKKAAKVWDIAKGDPKEFLTLLEDRQRPNVSEQQKLLDRLIDTWGRAGPTTRKKFKDFAQLAKRADV